MFKSAHWPTNISTTTLYPFQQAMKRAVLPSCMEFSYSKDSQCTDNKYTPILLHF